MRAIFVIKSPLLGHGEINGIGRIKLFALFQKSADTGICELRIFDGHTEIDVAARRSAFTLAA